MARNEFFLLAQDDTEYWDPDALPPGTIAALSIYLIKNGERTYCCSLTPSSWAVFIDNEFITPDPLEDPPYEPQDSTYFSFTPHNPDNPRHSALFTVDGRLSSENAWAEAEEHAHCNPPTLHWS